MTEILVVSPGVPAGRFSPPGDKSISHRAAMLLSMAEGEGRVRRYLDSADTNATLALLKSFGVPAQREPDGTLKVFGRGAGAFRPADGRWPVLAYCANAGTTMRLGAGLAAGAPLEVEFLGDDSLSRRPMDRVVVPLREMGARISARDDRFPPLRIRGGRLKGIRHVSAVASAQVKSCLLLAGLCAEGVTEIVEPFRSRDHTERMLRFLGVAVEESDGPEGHVVRLKGPASFRAAEIEVAGDPSAAAFLLCAAAAIPGASVTAEGISVNPTRSAFLDVLARMGAGVERVNLREVSGEPVADVTVRGAALRATEVGGAEVPRLIDEIPALTVAFAAAEGISRVRDAKELRVKETDRIVGIAEEFSKIGVRAEPAADGLSVAGPQRPAGGRAASRGDHRLAMALAAAGATAAAPVEVEGAEAVGVSYPGFVDALRAVGLEAGVGTPAAA